MQLRRLSALERQKIEDEYNALVLRIKDLVTLLLDPQAILATINKELSELKDVYGDPRRTKVIKGKLGEFSEEDLVAAEDNLVAITRDGYIKRMPLSTYRTQRRGGKGVVGMTTKDTDEILHMTVANTHDFILFFTNTGKVYSLRAFELPEGSRQAKGQAIINLLNIEQGENIQALLTVAKDTLSAGKHFVTMATSRGMIKKTALSEYSNIRATGKIGISLRDGDQLIKTELSHGQNYIILVTRGGKSIKFKETDVTPTGRDTMGVKGITLKESDEVIAMETVEINPAKPVDGRRKFFREILVVTEKGLGKRTSVD
jgi:DNA gyrase subunit A